MKVSELTQKLITLDQDMEVLVECDSCETQQAVVGAIVDDGVVWIEVRVE